MKAIGRSARYTTASPFVVSGPTPARVVGGDHLRLLQMKGKRDHLSTPSPKSIEDR